jgi:tRNA 2-thiouridine synthesizing protein E
MIKTDAEGFVVQADDWTRDVAEAMARDEVEGGLTDEHWKVIDYLRRYYLDFGSVPPVRKLARETGCNLNRAYKLFPSGLAKGACRLAGIPRLAVRPGLNYP